MTPAFREAFEESARASNLPLKRKGELYESTYTRTAFLLAYGTVNRLRSKAPPAADVQESKE